MLERNPVSLRNIMFAGIGIARGAGLQQIAFRVRYSLRGCRDVTCNVSTPTRTFGVPNTAAIGYINIIRFLPKGTAESVPLQQH
jgi:hypothetical protein